MGTTGKIHAESKARAKIGLDRHQLHPSSLAVPEIFYFKHDVGAHQHSQGGLGGRISPLLKKCTILQKSI